MSELLRRYGPEEIGSGMYSDLKNKSAPFWTNAENVIFTDLGARPLPGQSPIGNRLSTDEVTGIISNENAANYQLQWGTDNNLFGFTDGSAFATLGSSYSGGVWSMANWGAWVIATNGSDTPQVIKTTTAANIGGTPPTTAELVVVARNAFVIFLNTNSGPGHIRWSDIDDAEDYVTAAGNFSRQLTLRNLDSEIKSAINYRNEIAIFTDNSFHLLSFRGTPNIFGAEKLLEGFGAHSKHAVVEAQGTLFGCGPRGIWMIAGSSGQYVDTPIIRRFFLDNINWDARHKICAWHNLQERSIIWWFPQGTSTSNTVGLLLNYQDMTWSKVTYPRSAADNHNTLQYGVTASSDGFVWYQLTTGAAPGTNDGELQVSETFEGYVGAGMALANEQGAGGIMVP